MNWGWVVRMACGGAILGVCLGGMLGWHDNVWWALAGFVPAFLYARHLAKNDL